MMDFESLLLASNEDQKWSEISDPYERRKAIVRLGREMINASIQGTFQPMAFPLKHEFVKPNSAGNGQYIRSIFLPRGITVIGRIHRHEHFEFISQGHVRVFTEQEGLRELKAPYSGIAPAGCQRAISVLEDTIWTLVHSTNETDLDIIESKVIAESYSALGLRDPLPELISEEDAARLERNS
jgi:hypothetical protein